MCFPVLGRTCTNTLHAVTSLESCGLQSSHLSPCFREVLAQETPSSYQFTGIPKGSWASPICIPRCWCLLIPTATAQSLTSALPPPWESMANHLRAPTAVLPRCIPRCRLPLLSAWCISRPQIQQTLVNTAEPGVQGRMLLHSTDHAVHLKPLMKGASFLHYETGQHLCHPEGRQTPQQAKVLGNLREELAGTSSRCGTWPTLPDLHHAVSSGDPTSSEIPWPLFQGLPLPGKWPLPCTADAGGQGGLVSAPQLSHPLPMCFLSYSSFSVDKSVRWKAFPRFN